jgi:GGDEF domain-containing protein
MTETVFDDEARRALAADAFRPVLEAELKRALRMQTYLTLVLFEVRREWDGFSMAADDGTLAELGEVVGRDMRTTDLLALTGNGTLSVLLLDADREQSRYVVERFVPKLDSYEFATPLAISVGAACYPTDAVDAQSLLLQAMCSPLVSRRPGGTLGSTNTE